MGSAQNRAYDDYYYSFIITKILINIIIGPNNKLRSFRYFPLIFKYRGEWLDTLLNTSIN